MQKTIFCMNTFMDMTFWGGSPIVYLPNRLVIQFTGAQSVDGVSG